MQQSYDAVAQQYAVSFRAELSGKPLDRALLASLTEQAGPRAPVVDLGCGPGHVTAWLGRRGAAATGIDLSPAMIAAARRDYPDAEFRCGDLLSLPARDGEFAAAVVLYSIIHLEPAERPAAFREMHRVLRPGGLSLVAFHIGTEVRHFAEWYGQQVDLDFRFLQPDEVAALMEQAGFRVTARLERVSYPGEVDTRRGYLLGQR